MNTFQYGYNLICVFLCFLVSPTQAAVTSSERWFFESDVSAVWSQEPSKIYVNNGSPYPIPYNLDQYTVNKSDHAAFGIRAGKKWERSSYWFPGYAVAIQYQHVLEEKIKGVIIQYSLPQFTNYSYLWKISSDLINLYTKIDILRFSKIIPFVNAGIGFALNHASSYSESAFPGITARISPRYGDNRRTNLNYNLGIGVDYVFKPNLYFSIGYNFNYLGSISSNNGQATWAGDRLELPRYRLNMLSLGMTYYFDADK